MLQKRKEPLNLVLHWVDIILVILLTIISLFFQHPFVNREFSIKNIIKKYIFVISE